jgi:hypothetical protein
MYAATFRCLLAVASAGLILLILALGISSQPGGVRQQRPERRTQPSDIDTCRVREPRCHQGDNTPLVPWFHMTGSNNVRQLLEALRHLCRPSLDDSQRTQALLQHYPLGDPREDLP